MRISLLVINKNNHDNVYGAIIMTKVTARVRPVYLMNECQVAANPQISQLTWAMSPPKTCCYIHIHHCYCYYYSVRLTEGGRLTRRRHCSKGVQPVPKAVYRSSCRDKHIRLRCDSNMAPLTPQSDTLTTQLLRPT